MPPNGVEKFANLKDKNKHMAMKDWGQDNGFINVGEDGKISTADASKWLETIRGW